MPTVDRRKVVLIVAIAAVVVCAGAAWAIDPMECKWAPQCIFHLMTGWQCPGCGISRAAHAALHGHMAEALNYNWFFVISLPYAAALSVVNILPRLKIRRYVTHRYVAYGYVVLFMAWWVVRNVIGI